MIKKIFTVFIILVSFSNGYTQNNYIKELIILHWNDFHARNTPYKISKKDSLGNQQNYFIGGVSSLLGYLNKYRNDNTLVLNGGDDYQGSPISSITKGFSQIKLLNLFDLDAFVLGNHEFDYGAEKLDSSLMLAKFDYLSANIYSKNKNSTFGKPYVIRNINNIKIGIIGISPIDLMSLTLPQNVEQAQILNTDSVIVVNINTLKREKCDLIILLSHNGVELDSVFAEKFHGDIDIIIGGHSHTPIFKPKIVKGTLICQAGSYGRYLGKLDLKIDTRKDTIVYYFGKLIETAFDSAVYDKNAHKIVEDMLAEIEPIMKKPIGILLSDWKKNNLGQWQADEIRKKLNTDVTFLNAGGIRKELPKGDITIGDVWEINPFGNTLVKFTVSGKTLKKMISNNLKKAYNDEELGNYDRLIVSGIFVEYNSDLIKNSDEDFITGFKVGTQVLDENKNYTISTNNYTASQIKKYFGDIDERINIDDTNIIDRDLIIECIEQQKEINSVYEKRIKDIKEK